MKLRTNLRVSSMIKTDRLILRKPCLTDIDGLFEFLGDPEAMAFTHTDATWRECRKRVLVHEWFRRKDSAAPWVVADRADGRVIGWGGLYQDPFERGWGYEVGYYFHPDVWGRGFASELVERALVEADERLKLPEVWAMVHPRNPASKRVLEKAGFLEERFLPERPRYLLRRPRPLAEA